jgi:lipopolysaccharide transport system permease protein
MDLLKAGASAHDPGDADLVIVDTTLPEPWFDFRELWRYRDLVWILALRDITVRYRQTVVGIAWTVLQPLALMFAFGLFKQMVTTTKSDDGSIPDVVFTLCGLILYQLFAGMISASTICLVENRQMLTKVYFPRICLPLAASMRPVVDFGIGMILLIAVMCWFRVTPNYAVLFAPLIVLGTGLVGLAFGMWLSALNAHYRDFGHLVPFSLNLGLLVSPVAFSSRNWTEGWKLLYFLNPMASLIECFRWSMLGAATLPGWAAIGISAASATALLITGAWYFRRVDRFLADNI